MIEAFPLQWPEGFPRHAGRKISSTFKCTLGQARDGVLSEIKRIGGSAVIISSNIPVKNDGNLYASLKPVDNDHATAVYFTWKDDQVVLACDRYETIRENLRAIEKSLEAIRGLERWGCSDILNRTFTGFKALPEQTNIRTWWEVLQVTENSSREEIKKNYRRLVKQYHPDMPDGDRERFAEVHRAYTIAIGKEGADHL